MSRREVVVVLKPAAASHTFGFNVNTSVNTTAAAGLASALASFGATIHPMFDLGAGSPLGGAGALPGGAHGSLFGLTPSSTSEPGELARFHYVKVDDASAEKLVEELKKSELVEAAYIKPAVGLPLAPPRPGAEYASMSEAVRERVAARRATSTLVPQPPQVRDYAERQGYLEKAPGGVDARFAWSLLGGKGTDVRVIDIEGGWTFSHVDLRMNSGGVLGGTSLGGAEWTHHGTAVLGEIGGDENLYGVVGIAPEARLSAVSHTLDSDPYWGSARAIQYAAGLLSRGDILLLEMHRPGPRYNYEDRDDQKGYIAVEWWPDDFLAIQFAVARGIIVVEAAGNGDQNFDDPFYDTPDPYFPPSWRNPLGGAIDSGAVMVGAGAPPPGTHERDNGPDRSRLYFSNYGRRVDCQAWGLEVTTTGYGDLYGYNENLSEDYWYTDTFGGTSSASPIVAGVIASLQGIAKKRGQLLLPLPARALLRSQGTPQTDGPSGTANDCHIGVRPDLRKLVNAMFGIA